MPGTFRDTPARKIQDKIKRLLAEMHWTQAEAARCVYCELHDSDHEGEIVRYIETFKKVISRPTTKPEHLEAICKILSQQRPARQLAKIKLTYASGEHLSPEGQREMREISRMLDQSLTEDGEDTL